MSLNCPWPHCWLTNCPYVDHLWQVPATVYLERPNTCCFRDALTLPSSHYNPSLFNLFLGIFIIFWHSFMRACFFVKQVVFLVVPFIVQYILLENKKFFVRWNGKIMQLQHCFFLFLFLWSLTCGINGMITDMLRISTTLAIVTYYDIHCSRPCIKDQTFHTNYVSFFSFFLWYMEKEGCFEFFLRLFIQVVFFAQFLVPLGYLTARRHDHLYTNVLQYSIQLYNYCTLWWLGDTGGRPPLHQTA